MTNNVLRLVNVSRSFGATEVFRNLSLDIAQGEFVAIVGPSGCGKTTLLNLLSAYDQPNSGTIERQGVVRMIYQEGGLLPWLTAGQNIAMSLRDLPAAAERDRQLEELLALIGLQSFEDHYPHQLSGGMRQRVELARALGGDSDVLLMDEPFSALDYLTRLKMRGELSRLLRERPRTVVLVTHDIEEAAHLADRIVVLSERPARIHCELQISLPRPRNLTHPEVINAVHCILTELGIESTQGAGARVSSRLERVPVLVERKD